MSTTNQTLAAPGSAVTGATRPRSHAVDLETVHHNRIVSVITDSIVLARRSLMKIPRQPDWLMGATIQPIMFLLLFRYIFAGTIQYAMPPGVSAVSQGLRAAPKASGSVVDTRPNSGVLDLPRMTSPAARKARTR